MTVSTIRVRNVNGALPRALMLLNHQGVVEETRNGPCLVAPGPVITEYDKPCERILWEPRRDANPVFHLMEALWMLAGDNRVGWLIQFNGRMASYSDVGGVLRGAYGHRWRVHFLTDQLPRLINHLRSEPNTRRAVLTMWDPVADLNAESHDIPCNTHIYFDRRGGVLNMTVACRSNDMLWGAYGANVVHFSVLQEVIAHAVGVPVGCYRQLSNNFHVYTDLPQVKDLLVNVPLFGEEDDHYWQMEPTPLLKVGESWQNFLDDCQTLIDGGVRFFTSFVGEVARPLRDHYLARRAGVDLPMRVEGDWGLAYRLWLSRLEKRNG